MSTVLVSLLFLLFSRSQARFIFDFDEKNKVNGLNETEEQLSDVEDKMAELEKLEKEGERAPKPFLTFTILLKKAANEAQITQNESLKKLKITVDTLMTKLDEAYVEGEKSLARIVVRQNRALETRLSLVLNSMATTQKLLLDLSTNIVVLIARNSISDQIF